MRVKIQGEITAERLATALEKASEQYEKVRPGFKIYGAYLYLTAFDSDGLPLNVADPHGGLLKITIKAAPGCVVKPALTAEGEARRQRSLEDFDADVQAIVDENRRMWEESQLKYEAARARFDLLNAITSDILAKPNDLVNELNLIVQNVWKEKNPIETHGKRRGQPRALPVFRLENGSLFLSMDSWKKPRKVHNPLCTFSYGEPFPHWNHRAWLDVHDQISGVLVSYLSDPARIEALVDADEYLRGKINGDRA